VKHAGRWTDVNEEHDVARAREIGSSPPARYDLSESASEDVALSLLVDLRRAAEECLDSFIDIAAGSYSNKPKRSTHNSEPTLPSATDFDQDALSFASSWKRTFDAFSVG
jgi:hypothetical protein